MAVPGLALSLLPFLDAPGALLASALSYDVICVIIFFAYMTPRGRLKNTLVVIKARSGKVIVLGALLGGPFGMAGHFIAINNVGPDFIVIIPTSYPAVGTFLVYVFLKERMRPHQIFVLFAALGAITLIEYSSTGVTSEGDPIIRIIAILACVFDWGSETVIPIWGVEDDEVDEDSTLQIRKTTSVLIYLAVIGPTAEVIGFTFTATSTLATGIIALTVLAGTCSYLFYYKTINTVGTLRGMALNISYSAWVVILTFLIMGTASTLLQVIYCPIIPVGTVSAATPD